MFFCLQMYGCIPSDNNYLAPFSINKSNLVVSYNINLFLEKINDLLGGVGLFNCFLFVISNEVRHLTNCFAISLIRDEKMGCTLKNLELVYNGSLT